MILQIQNENYGYAVASSDMWVAIGNPSFNAWPPLTASTPTSGSADLYLYDRGLDYHVLVERFWRHLLPEEEILLATATGSDIIDTEATGSVSATAHKDIAIDFGQYLTASVNDYGRAVDIHSSLLGIGYTYNRAQFVFDSGSLNITSSGGVDLYNIATYDYDPFTYKNPIVTFGSQSAGGILYFSMSVPPGYTAVEVQHSTDLVIWDSVTLTSVDYVNGGNYLISVPYDPGAGAHYYRGVDYIPTSPYVTTINNPEPSVSNSFGTSISINDNWLAIGSPESGSDKGAVYLYQRYGGNHWSTLSWSLYQVITASDGQAGDLFGWSLELNDAPGVIAYTASTNIVAYSSSLVVGTNRPSGSKVYYFEISGSRFGTTASFTDATWREISRLDPIHAMAPLTFYNSNPIFSGSYSGSVADRFGYDVSIYGDTIVVGAPYDRYIYEYISSSVYKQGAFYIFKRCSPADNGFYLLKKSFGDSSILTNNRLGWAVDVWDKNILVGAPKTTVDTLSPCYAQGATFQPHFCSDALEYQLNGQFCYLQYNTNSLDWDLKNIFQNKKRYLQPYRNYGFAVDGDNRFLAIGAPMNFTGSDRIIAIDNSASIADIGPVAGQAYIYNYHHYQSGFTVGNVFYRNGKLVFITSGSNFDGLAFNPVADADYEYGLAFKNKQTLFEKQIVCQVSPGEFNVSTNPTALSVTQSLFDINGNGRFDYQDVDVMLMYMNWKATENSGNPNTNWSSSILVDPAEISLQYYLDTSGSFYGTDALYSQSFARFNTTTMFSEFDFNQDSRIDNNDLNILWKYFAFRLNQKNYDKYITTTSKRRLYSDLLDHLSQRTARNQLPYIKPEFFDYERLSKTDITGSYLTTYVTTIGLYNGLDLVAVAKLGSPVKLIPDYPYNFVVRIDF